MLILVKYTQTQSQFLMEHILKKLSIVLFVWFLGYIFPDLFNATNKLSQKISFDKHFKDLSKDFDNH